MLISKERPAYRILAPHGWFGPDDHLYQEGECVYWDGEPNEEMEPLNEIAVEFMQLYVAKLDKLAEDAAKRANRPFIGRPRDAEGAYALARKAEIDKVAIMNAPKDVTSVERVEAEPVPETGAVNVKKGRGKPDKGSLRISDAA